ncbi:MAG: hypothetical protein ACO1OQ_05340 [Rufibacter sp.]
MRIRFLLLVACFYGLVGQGFAQTDSLKKYVLGVFITAPIEFPVIDTKALNQQLNAQNFPSATYPVASLGIGMQLHTHRFISTFSYNQWTNETEQKAHLTEVEYRSTTLNVGYDFLTPIGYALYPYLGFKGTGLNYLYREKILGDATFEDYIKTDLQYKEITNSRAHLDLGVGFSHQAFYLINLRAGYLVPLEKARWNINNNDTTLPGSPGVHYQFYFTLTLGAGYLGYD